MSFCHKCGANLPDGSVFCSNCGSSTQNAQPVNNYYQPPVAPVVMAKPKIPGRGFGISAMVLGILGLVFSFFSLVDLPDTLELYDEFYGWYYSSAIEELLYSVLVIAIFPILSICFAPAAYKRGYKNGVSTSGLVLGVISLILCFVMFMMISSYL